MTKLMEKANTSTQMVLSTKASGRKTSSMVMVRKRGQMELATKAPTRREGKMATANLFGLMGQRTKVTLLTTISMGWVCIHGLIKGNTMESGRIIRCTVRESLLGKMAESMMESTLMIRNKDMVYLHGQMEGSTKGTG